MFLTAAKTSQRRQLLGYYSNSLSSPVTSAVQLQKPHNITYIFAEIVKFTLHVRLFHYNCKNLTIEKITTYATSSQQLKNTYYISNLLATTEKSLQE